MSSLLPLALPGGAGAVLAAPLNVVDVTAPAVYCVFSPTCTVSGDDSSGTFALPGMAGLARLQSRTLTGSPGAPAAGRHVYQYRLDLRQVAGIVNIACVTSLSLEFGTVVSNLDYDGDGAPGDQVFVVSSGGAGNVAPTSAVRTGSTVTFHFGTPVCAGAYIGDGDSTYFIGLASPRPPRSVTAHVSVSPGGASLDVGARAPRPPLTAVFGALRLYLRALPPDALAGSTPAEREARRLALLDRVDRAEGEARRDRIGESVRILTELAGRVDGRGNDWVVDEPETPQEEPAEVWRLVRDVVEALGGSLPTGERPGNLPDFAPRRGTNVPCGVGRYRVEGGPLVPGRERADSEVVSLVGGRVSIGDVCDPVEARLRMGRAGTHLSARWRSCDGLPGGARLQAVIDDATCTTLQGRFQAPDLPRPVAVRAQVLGCQEDGGTESDSEDGEEECPPLDFLALQFQRWRHEYVPQAFPRPYPPQGAHARAFAQTAAAPIALDQFSSLGPAPIGTISSLPGQNGRVDAIAVDPANHAHWLLGASGGGVWETADGGLHWNPRTDNQPSLTVSAIAFAPTRPSVVYAGTGSPNGPALGAGVLRSLDGGQSWALTGTNTLAGLSVGALQVSNASPRVVVAAASRWLRTLFHHETPPSGPPAGVYRTTNGGSTWSLVLPGEASDVLVRPGDFSRQYAGLCGHAIDTMPWVQTGEIRRSFDGGQTWVTVQGPWTFQENDPSEVRFAAAPSQPDTLYVSLRSTMSFSGWLLGLWRTDNAWAPTPTWVEIPWVGPFPQGYLVGRPNHTISVHPSDPDVLYATGIALWRHRSGTWTDVTGTDTHADHNALAWAGTRLIAGNDGGIYSRVEGAGSLPPGAWTSHNTNLSIVQLYGGAAHPLAPSKILAGAQDNGVLRRLPQDPPAWDRISGADGIGAFPGGSTQHWAYWSQGLGLRRSKDGGQTSEMASIGIAAAARPFRAPVVRCPADPDFVLAGAKRVWRTKNFFSATTGPGIVWRANSPAPSDTTNSMNFVVTAIAFAPSDGACSTYAYANDQGEVRMTQNAGVTWKNLDRLGQLPDRQVNGLAFSPTSADTLYVAAAGFDGNTPGHEGHLFRTTSATLPTPSWSAVGPPVDIPHNDVAVSPFDASTVYVATDLGAWVSADAAATWKHIGPANGIPNVPVKHVDLDPCGVTLFTYGRGVFRNSVPVACP